MIVARRTIVVGNPAKRRSVVRAKPKKKKAHVSSKGNPAYLMVLGPANPKRSSSMAKKAKKNNKKAAGHRLTVTARAHSKNAPKKRSITKQQVKAFMKKHRMGSQNKRRASSNPFAKTLSLGRASDIVTAAAGVLIGVFLNKTIVGFLPASIASNPLYATLGSVGAAFVEWWVLSMVHPEFGAAAGLGGFAEAASLALTNYMPSVGGSLALSGRGQGDFVPGSFTVPQNPVLDAATGLPLRQVMAPGAYPKPYQVSGS